VMAGPIMSIFGKHFEDAVPILRILMIATVVNAATGPTGTMLIMCGRERSVWKLAMATLVAAVGLCIGAQLLYGVIGLSWMLVFSLVMENAVLVLLVKRHLGFWPIGPIKKRLQASQ
jgi:O-antigen/teichoic acid export membrane protein